MWDFLAHNHIITLLIIISSAVAKPLWANNRSTGWMGGFAEFPEHTSMAAAVQWPGRMAKRNGDLIAHRRLGDF